MAPRNKKSRKNQRKKSNKIGVDNVKNYQLTHIYKGIGSLTKITANNKLNITKVFKKQKLTNSAWKYLMNQLENLGISVNNLERNGGNDEYWSIQQAQESFPLIITNNTLSKPSLNESITTTLDQAIDKLPDYLITDEPKCDGSVDHCDMISHILFALVARDKFDLENNQNDQKMFLLICKCKTMARLYDNFIHIIDCHNDINQLQSIQREYSQINVRYNNEYQQISFCKI